MGDETIEVCCTPAGGSKCNTHVVCWCESHLTDLVDKKKLKAGASGDDVKYLQEHLVRFGMQVELGELKAGKFVPSEDQKNSKWDVATTRAVRMFGLHPEVGSEPRAIITGDGKEVTKPLADKIRSWCRGKVVSPQNYWEFKEINLKDGDKDAVGSKADPQKQTVFHDFVVQVERDLAKCGFAAHVDSLCGLKATHKNQGMFLRVKANAKKLHEDKNLEDTAYLVNKFQRQAKWLWRMKIDGTHLPDASPSDASVFGGKETGEVDNPTALVLQEWASKDLHMVIEKFELTPLYWPPTSTAQIVDADSGGGARLRRDAQEAWLKAAQEIEALGGTLRGPYASSPRSWRGGKKSSSHASSYSWHYSGLGFDLGQHNSSDGTISDKFSYGLEKDGTEFRIWCWADPQPTTPSSPSDDKKDPLRQYRNRNIKYKHEKGRPNEMKKPGDPTEPAVLYFATSRVDASKKDVVDVTAREGWYVDLTTILAKHNLERIPRHKDWLTNPKGWEFWHYQFKPAPPPGASADPTFGEYLQLHGVHELQLRAVGWSAHEDIDHPAG